MPIERIRRDVAGYRRSECTVLPPSFRMLLPILHPNDNEDDDTDQRRQQSEQQHTDSNQKQETEHDIVPKTKGGADPIERGW